MNLERMSLLAAGAAEMNGYLLQQAGQDDVLIVADSEQSARKAALEAPLLADRYGGSLAEINEISAAEVDAAVAKRLATLIVVSTTGVEAGSEFPSEVAVLIDTSLGAEDAEASVIAQLERIMSESGANTLYEAFPLEQCHGAYDTPEFAEAALLAAKMAVAADAESEDPEQDSHVTMRARMERYLSDAIGEVKPWGDRVDYDQMDQESPWFECGLAGSMERVAEVIATALGSIYLQIADVVAENLVEHARTAYEDAMYLNDTTSMGDLIGGDHYVVWVPGLSRSGLEDILVMADSNTGDAFNIIPDENFAEFLTIANVSSDEWIAFIESTTGESLADSRPGAEAWAQFSVEKADPQAPARIDVKNVLEILENTNGHGVTALAVKMNINDIVSLRPGDTVQIKGGQFGIHDYINGSGHVDDVLLSPLTIKYNPEEWIVDRANQGGVYRYGFNSVYDMVDRAYKAEIEFPQQKEARATYAAAFSRKLKAAIAEGFFEEKDGQRVAPESNNLGFRPGMTLVEGIKAAQSEYWTQVPDLDDVLTDAERESLMPVQRGVSYG